VVGVATSVETWLVPIGWVVSKRQSVSQALAGCPPGTRAGWPAARLTLPSTYRLQQSLVGFGSAALVALTIPMVMPSL
jgi:hypothetical protein